MLTAPLKGPSFRQLTGALDFGVSIFNVTFSFLVKHKMDLQGTTTGIYNLNSNDDMTHLIPHPIMQQGLALVNRWGIIIPISLIQRSTLDFSSIVSSGYAGNHIILEQQTTIHKY